MRAQGQVSSIWEGERHTGAGEQHMGGGETHRGRCVACGEAVETDVHAHGKGGGGHSA